MSERLVFRSEPVDSADLATAFAGSVADRFYWERPDRSEAYLGLGAVVRLEAHGPGALAEIAERARALWRRVDSTACASQALPRLVGGAAFDPGAASDAGWAGFPGARFVLPAHAWYRRGDRSWRVSWTGAPAPAHLGLAATGAVTATPEAPELRLASRETPEDWIARATRARQAIADGAFEKLVLARAIELEASAPLDVPALLAALRERHPECTIFAVGIEETVFLGATPEQLVEVGPDARVQAAALAGSAPRGRSPEEDCRLERALRESKKEQEEHAIVVRALRDGLAPACSELEFPEAPECLATHGIQHLHTPFAGRLADPTRWGALELAMRLHPSPAVAGAPGPEAVAWLREHEALARGWYAGPVGWLEATGQGALAVALRSARVCGARASLFAGAGLVAASDPRAEHAETRLKLRAVLDPLLTL